MALSKIGSSLLDFLKVEEIENLKKLWYPSKKFYIISVNINNNQQYDMRILIIIL